MKPIIPENSSSSKFRTFSLNSIHDSPALSHKTISSAVWRQSSISCFSLFCHTRISSAILRQATYGTIKFGTYYSFKQLATEKWGTDDIVLINVVCAAIAGSISSAIANPTDVVKVRMQISGNETNRSLYGCFHDVYQHEGARGLWRVNFI